MIEINIRTTGLMNRGRTQRWRNVLPRFQKEGGDILIKAVQDLLGTAGLYVLSPPYSEKKSLGLIPGMRRIAGKAADQPLILTGEGIYDALQMVVASDGFTVQIDPDKGWDNGFDYAEYWADRTQFMEIAVRIAEPELVALLETIIVQEMLL